MTCRRCAVRPWRTCSCAPRWGTGSCGRWAGRQPHLASFLSEVNVPVRSPRGDRTVVCLWDFGDARETPCGGILTRPVPPGPARPAGSAGSARCRSGAPTPTPVPGGSPRTRHAFRRHPTDKIAVRDRSTRLTAMSAHFDVVVLGSRPGWICRGDQGRPARAQHGDRRGEVLGRSVPQRGVHPVEGAVAQRGAGPHLHPGGQDLRHPGERGGDLRLRRGLHPQPQGRGRARQGRPLPDEEEQDHPVHRSRHLQRRPHPADRPHRRRHGNPHLRPLHRRRRPPPRSCCRTPRSASAW